MRTLALLGLAVLAGLAVWLAVGRETTPRAGEVLELRGLVTRVVDGDTLHVRVGRTRERVRLLGIDAPERGECFAVRATAMLRALALYRVADLAGDRTQPVRDRYDRLLAYAALPGVPDAGRSLVVRGGAVVFETRPRFGRRAAYTAAEAEAKRRNAGLHGACD